LRVDFDFTVDLSLEREVSSYRLGYVFRAFCFGISIEMLLEDGNFVLSSILSFALFLLINI
jgi:hypothetical protein